MTHPHIQRRFRTMTDPLLLDAAGESLRTIRDQDGVTNAHLGRVLGRSKATIERYVAGERAMPFTAFVRGCKEWDGRFADGPLAYAGMRLVPIETVQSTDQHALADLCDLAACIAVALQDGVFTPAERAALAPKVRHVMAELGRISEQACLYLPGVDTS